MSPSCCMRPPSSPLQPPHPLNTSHARTQTPRSHWAQLPHQGQRQLWKQRHHQQHRGGAGCGQGGCCCHSKRDESRLAPFPMDHGHSSGCPAWRRRLQEVEKLQWSTIWGADTVMDLRQGAGGRGGAGRTRKGAPCVLLWVGSRQAVAPAQGSFGALQTGSQARIPPVITVPPLHAWLSLPCRLRGGSTSALCILHCWPRWCAAGFCNKHAAIKC